MNFKYFGEYNFEHVEFHGSTKTSKEGCVHLALAPSDCLPYTNVLDL